MEPIIIKTKGATYIDNDRQALNPDRGEFRKAITELTDIVNNTKFNISEIIANSEITTTTVFTDITDSNNPIVVTDDIQNLSKGVLRQHTIQAMFTLPENYIIAQINIEKSTGNTVIYREDIVDNTIKFILDANIKLTVETEHVEPSTRYCTVTVRCTNENFDSYIDVSVTPNDIEGGAGDYNWCTYDVPLGTHQFTITAVGYKSKVIEITINENDLDSTKEVTFTLDPETTSS